MQLRIYLKSILLIIIILNGSNLAHADPACLNCIVFPTDAGHLNVRDFGAKGDGITDDTNAFNAALTASGADLGRTIWKERIVYIPDGIYLITKPIEKRYKDRRYGSGLILIGQSRDKTIIRLQDNAVGYNNKNLPRPIIYTTSKLLATDPNSGGRDYKGKGEGNDAYMNTIENLTIDSGRGNPGAIGIDYLANNLGTVRNVKIEAATGSGTTGISITRKWPGPALIKDVLIKGFDVGVDISQTEYGITIENLILHQQKYIGLRNDKNVVSIHNLQIENAPTPLQNKSPQGLIVITQGNFSGPAEGRINNYGYLNLRGLKVNGYTSLFKENGPSLSTLDGIYKSNEKTSISSQPWSLPIKEPPKIKLPPAKTWANVEAYGAAPNTGKDVTKGIIKTFASGNPVVYFPHGTYLISNNITIPSSVKYIVGMTSTIAAFPQRGALFSREKGMFRAANMTSPLIIERLTFDHTDLGNQVGIEAIGDQPLILRDIFTLGTTMLKRPVGAGEIFLENVCCGSLDISGNKGIWARQLNSEGGGIRIFNKGSPLWILGLKTERNTTVIKNTGGAITELMGGLIYIVEPTNGSPATAFINQNSKLSLSYVEEAFDPQSTYAIHLLNKRSGEELKTVKEMLIPRNEGRIVPLLLAD